jgi:hypothetical protein
MEFNLIEEIVREQKAGFEKKNLRLSKRHRIRKIFEL